MTMTEEQKVLRNFMTPDGRLKQIPVKQSKRDIILTHLATLFDVGVRYPEREVNEIIKRVHPDFATLRRALVDGRWMDRENNVYWRTAARAQT